MRSSALDERSARRTERARRHSANSVRRRALRAGAQRERYASVMKIALLLVLSLPGLANAGQLCKPVKSKGEGHWPIPEEDFTKERAESATRELMELLKRADAAYLTSKHAGGLDLSPYVLNRLVYIKGFALKSEALEDIELRNKNASKWSEASKSSTDAFCKFLAEEALVWH